MVIRAAEWLRARILEFLTVIRLTRANLVDHFQGTLKHLNSVFDRNLARLMRVDRRRVTSMHISIKIPSLSVLRQEAAQLTVDKNRVMWTFLACIHVYGVRSQLSVIRIQMLSVL